MREAAGLTEVHINYLGACKGCPSATVGTLSFVEDFLKAELDQNIRVLPV
jgi:NifU-like protein